MCVCARTAIKTLRNKVKSSDSIRVCFPECKTCFTTLGVCPCKFQVFVPEEIMKKVSYIKPVCAGLGTILYSLGNFG